MTTIAYKNGVMACDSCWGMDRTVDTLSRKLYRLKSGAILGQAGANDARHFTHLLDAVKTAAQLPSYDDLLKMRIDFLGLLVLPKGRIFKIATTMISDTHWDADMEKDLGVWEIEMPFTAIGTGTDFAIGAMEAGADARAAVRIACRRDLNSRLPVHTMALTIKPTKAK